MIDPLYTVKEKYIPNRVLLAKNKNKSWKYGYDEKYDVVVISKDGTIGEVYDISGLIVALPSAPKNLPKESNKWVYKNYPDQLKKVRTIFDWNKRDDLFKSKWVDYIETEFNKRDQGHWFMNNNKPTYLTGTHYMYLQWTKIDVGRPDFREANRIFYIF